MNIIIYTANIGDYDHIHELKNTSSLNILYLTKTDAPTIETWHNYIVPLPAEVDECIRLARDIKIRPYLWLPEHDVSIWIDGNLQLIASAENLTKFVRDHEIATFAYPSTFGPRDCLYQEANACIRRKKDSPEIIQKQIQRYRDDGYPEHNGLVETSVIVRRNTPKIRKFGEAWWEELKNGSRRDQISFNYVSWKHGLNYGTIPGCRIDNNFTLFQPHKINIYT
jgi:hypothetical protein